MAQSVKCCHRSAGPKCRSTMLTRKREPVILGLEVGKEAGTLECSLTCELQVQLETMSGKKRKGKLND